MPLAGAKNRGGGGGGFPARRRLAGGREVGERQEGGESYSKVGLSRSGAASDEVGGGAVARRRRRAAAAPLRRGRKGDDRPGSFTGPRESEFGGQFVSRRGGE